MKSQNPWWYQETDKTYEEWVRKQIKWVPPVVEQFSFEPFSLNFLVGPRQVGKTTALKIWINNVLLPNVNPRAVFYFSCEELTGFRELGEVLDNYVSFKNGNRIKSSFIILDEITFVEDWHRALKLRIDRDVFRNDVILVSGSASLEILKQKEYFPGRRGKGRDIVFHPLSFSQYVKALKNFETEKKDIMQAEYSMKTNRVHQDLLNELFNKYLLTGGFPLSIEDMYTRNRITFETRKTYMDWLRSDFAKLGRNEAYMKEVLAYIVRARLTPVSWLSISRETSISSPHTTQAYVEDLEKLFTVKILNFLGADSKILYRKNKKIHIADPFLYDTICELVNVKPIEEDKLESVVATHLARKYPVFYWRNKTEVDIVILVNNKQFGIEVKTTSGSWIKPKHLKNARALTRPQIPLFLASIDV
ncbi:MAG: ATP-binding protein [Candidatus Brockarchaeota archaeon]|nr:ATP-binding protein [Candidatus Brockarchaeota archaeon]MBO3809150.1 ATP-binding protein [Candidatus Brockarchaeota archaeon]